ncbi:MAG: hypothetical protein ABI625_12035, partial [bacterium]
MKKQKKRAAPRVVEAPIIAERPGIRWPLGAAAFVIMMLGVVPMANLVTTGGGLSWWSEAVRQWFVWNAIIAVAAIALGIAFSDAIERAIARGANWLVAPAPRTFALAVGVATCLLALYFGWRLFEWQPVVGDEFAQRFQSRLLSMGRLFAHTQQPAEFFSTPETLDVSGRWFAQFPIGGPAILAIGVLAGVPALINPVLAGVAAVALYRFAAAIGDEVTARLAAILFALSPFVLFMAGSEMNHVSTLALLLVALAALPRWVAAESEKQARSAAAVIGVGLGVAATIRPLDAAVVGLVIGVFQVRTALTSRLHLRSLFVEFLAGAVPVLLLFCANWVTVGQPFAFAYDVLNGPEHRPGFHVTPLGFEHTPRRGLYIISAYLMKLDVGLFAWPVPAMLLVVAALVLQRRATAWDALLLGILALLLGGYFAYWSESYFVGPRFLFTAVPIFVLYTARFAGLSRSRIHVKGVRSAVALLIPLWLVCAWTAPSITNQMFGVRQLADNYRAHGTGAAITRAVRTAGLTNVVVFIPEGFHGQLAARLRALGVRPLIAEQMVARSDACTLQEALEAAANTPTNSIEQRIQVVMQALARDSGAAPLAGLAPDDQLALVRSRAPSPTCRASLERAISPGGTMAEMLPYQGFTSDGEMGGPVV